MPGPQGGGANPSLSPGPQLRGGGGEVVMPRGAVLVARQLRF